MTSARGARTHKVRRRYYSPDDPTSYVTPSRLKRLGRENQIAHMVHWFRGMYEDPANETPYDSDEGGYQYIWGGPYEATEELGAEFGDIVSEAVLDAAVSEIERDGTFDWAPTTSNPDHRAWLDEEVEDARDAPLTSLQEIRERLTAGSIPQFGDAVELDYRATLRKDIENLRDLLKQAPANHGRIGHNRPPESLQLSVEMRVEIGRAVDEIDAEVSQRKPDIENVVRSTGRLEKVIAWFGRKLDIAVDAFMTKIGSAAGVATIVGVLALSPVGEKVLEVFKAALVWLNAVTLPF